MVGYSVNSVTKNLTHCNLQVPETQVPLGVQGVRQSKKRTIGIRTVYTRVGEEKKKNVHMIEATGIPLQVKS